MNNNLGHEKAFAICLAFASPKVEMLGLTSVAGNSYLEDAMSLPCSLLPLVGHEVNKTNRLRLAS